MILKKYLIRLFLFGFLLHLISAASFSQSRHPVIAKKGMVVSSERHATEAGLQILKSGGNATDAAVATAFALAVTLPGAGNLGGGGFLVYAQNGGTVTTIDFREKAPITAFQKMYLDGQGEIRNSSNTKGILSVGVPGTVAGLALAHQKYGSKPWRSLVEPAIQLAEKGFPVSYALSKNFSNYKNNFLKYPSSAKIFLKKDDSNYLPGDIWYQPDLANTLRRIQKDGKVDFYNGKTAQLIADFMRQNGGLITLEDLKKYKAIERKPVRGEFRDYDIYAMGPPSSGGVTLIEMLNILEGYDLASMGHNSAKYLHVLTEAMRLAFLDRAMYLGDPDFNPNLPVDKMISKLHASKQRDRIHLDKTIILDIDAINQIPESSHTTHFSVLDLEGNAVSLTYTIESWYGSKIVVEGAGFLLNNEMGDFNPIPGRTDEKGKIGTKPNLIEPEKRMLSSMCPTIVLKNNNPFLIIGTPGGRTIINTVLQVVLNVIDFEMNIAEAIAARRIHHQWMPNVTVFEEGVISVQLWAYCSIMKINYTLVPQIHAARTALHWVIDQRLYVFHPSNFLKLFYSSAILSL